MTILRFINLVAGKCRPVCEERLRDKLADDGHGIFGHDWADQDSIKVLIRSRSREEDVREAELQGLHMLIIGTLVWGFWDLVGAIV